MRHFSVIVFLLISLTAQSQNLRCKWMYPKLGTQVLDSLIIEPESVQITSDDGFDFNLSTREILLFSESDSVQVCYRVMSPEVFRDIFNRPLSQYEASRMEQIARPNTSSQELFQFRSDLNKSGYISRGITFGNRQNLFVNSTLNLQLQGKISDNLNIDAVITDQNIPYQPEGNTQQIRDFDNVYIRLYNDQFELRAGDVVFKNPNSDSYFLQYYKNVQGLQFNYKSQLGSWTSRSSIGTSAAKGKFANVTIDAVEGSQGPYPLRGPNGERFIIILANSEQIFLDGKPLERGFDRDYVIDYNLAQITFNANVLITQFSVINVNFEYAEQFYTRTSTAISQSLENDKTSIRFNYYQEEDNESGNLGYQPSITDLEVLRNAGDDLSLAQVIGVDSIGFTLDRILYKKIDSLDLDGVTQSVFKYSTSPDSVFFVVNFTEVGFGNGDYVEVRSTTNGRVFEWVSPQGGVSQGNFQPTRNVPLPISKRMFSIGVTQKVNAFESVTQELAVSTVDRNLYSDMDDGDNQGLAWMGRIESRGREIGRGYQLHSSLFWELDQAEFRAMDRYRPILFDRDWDYTASDSSAVDLIGQFKVGFEKDEDHQLSYSAIHRNREGTISGWQHSAELNQSLGNLYLRSDHFLLNNTAGGYESNWVRSFNDLSFRVGQLVPGVKISLDQNERAISDSLASTRMHYFSREVYLTTSDSSRTRMRLSYELRDDKTPFEGNLVDFTNAENIRASFARSMGKQEVELAGTYRHIKDRIAVSQDEWLNARAVWDGRFLRESVKHRLTYQVGNVREQRRNFIYLLVGGNQGTHAWRDENEDGIKDLNEFYEAVNPDERQYAKFFTPTDEFITAFETRYQHSITGRFPISWRNQPGFRSFLSKWTSRVDLNIHYKTTSKESTNRLNPFSLTLRDDKVLFTANRYFYQVSYNQTGNGLGWTGDFARNERKQLLTNGFEYGSRKDWSSVFNWRFNREYNLSLNSTYGTHSNESDFLVNRNLEITSTGIGPEIVWQPSLSLRIKGGYDLRTKENKLPETQAKSTLNEVNAEITWNRSGKGMLNAAVRWIQIDFSGEDNNYTAYQLLEALRPGQNTTWRLNWQQQLSNGIQMNLQYNGRTSEGNAPVHTGTVMMTAYF